MSAPIARFGIVGLGKMGGGVALNAIEHGFAVAALDTHPISEEMHRAGVKPAANMEELVRHGVTHIIDMQIEFDDRPLAEPYPVEVLFNPTDDDFLPKPPELFQSGATIVNIHSGQSDQRKVIEFYGKEVLPKLREVKSNKAA